MKSLAPTLQRWANQVAKTDLDAVRDASGNLDLNASIAENREHVPLVEGTRKVLEIYRSGRDFGETPLQSATTTGMLFLAFTPWARMNLRDTLRNAGEVALYAVARRSNPESKLP